MIEALLRLMVLLAIFASVFIVAQLGLNRLWQRTAHTQAVNKRLKMIKTGASREQVFAELRKNEPGDYSYLPWFIAKPVTSLQRALMAVGLPITAPQLAFASAVAFVLLVALLLFMSGQLGFAISIGIIFLCGAIAACVAFVVPLLVLTAIAHRRRKKIEEQFPVALDVFVRALRAGHPIASAIDLLTRELEDPIGSEFGIVADEIAYGAELTDALEAMADRWNLDDIRMFVVSLSVQSETGGNLAEILQNLADVIRERASLYMKVRALSSEGRMTGWMLTALPIVAFVGMFSVNPEFYLATADEPMFLFGFITLGILYTIGFIWIRKLIDLKV